MENMNLDIMNIHEFNSLRNVNFDLPETVERLMYHELGRHQVLEFQRIPSAGRTYCGVFRCLLLHLNTLGDIKTVLVTYTGRGTN